MEVYKIHKHMGNPQGSPTPILQCSQKYDSRNKNDALNNTSVQKGKQFNVYKLSLFLTTKFLFCSTGSVTSNCINTSKHKYKPKQA
jgi:hypothetical protein